MVWESRGAGQHGKIQVGKKNTQVQILTIYCQSHKAQVTIIHKCLTLAVNPSDSPAFSELGLIIRNNAEEGDQDPFVFSVEVLIFRATSPQSPIKIKSLSLKQNIFMQKKVAVCSNGHPRAVRWASFLEQLSCRCGGGLGGLSAQPALLGRENGGRRGTSQCPGPLRFLCAPLTAPHLSLLCSLPILVGMGPGLGSACCEPFLGLGRAGQGVARGMAQVQSQRGVIQGPQLACIRKGVAREGQVHNLPQPSRPGILPPLVQSAPVSSNPCRC